MTLLQRSLSGAVLVGVIVLLRALFLHRLPKTTFLALWYVAVLRLLLPLPLASPLSLYTLLARASSGRSSGLAAVAAGAPPPAFAPPQMKVPVQGAAPISTASVIYLAVGCLLAAWFLLSYGACRRRFRTSLPAESAYVARWLQGLQGPRRVQVRVSGQIAAPLSYGFLHPVILLPKSMDWRDEEALGYILAHELIHIRRCDNLGKAFLALALCAHWFNPLAWALYALANRDMELACDELVVRKLGGAAKRGYALALIRMEETKGGFAPLYNHFSKLAIEERIIAIMKLKKKTALAAVLAVALLAGTTAVFATGADLAERGAAYAAEPAQTPAQPEDQALFADYAKFGLTFGPDGAMYYNGSLVRYFIDGYELEDGVCIARYTYFREDGVLDLHTQRRVEENGDGSVDPFGALLAVVRDSQEAFDARDLEPLKNPPQVTAVEGGAVATVEDDALAALAEGSAATTVEDDALAALAEGSAATTVEDDALAALAEGSAVTAVGESPAAYAAYEGAGLAAGKTFAQRFAAYAAYGISFESATGGRGNVYLHGALVKRFIDEGPGGVFTFESEAGGGIIARVVYDGTGAITGVAKD